MKLTYIYHSGFALELDSLNIIVDFFRTSDGKRSEVCNRLLKSDLPLYVLSSHSHDDHFNPEILKWKAVKEDITYVFSSDILEHKKAKADDAVYLKQLERYDDNRLRIKAYGSTDLGISFYIEVGDKKYFHAGDLNNWHWNEESTAEEIKEAEDFYHRELRGISSEVKQLDLAMFPIDSRLGKDFMKGAEEFIRAVPTNVLTPMHFSSDPEKIKLFEPIARKHHCQYICWSHPNECVII